MTHSLECELWNQGCALWNRGLASSHTENQRVTRSYPVHFKICASDRELNIYLITYDSKVHSDKPLKTIHYPEPWEPCTTSLRRKADKRR